LILSSYLDGNSPRLVQSHP